MLPLCEYCKKEMEDTGEQIFMCEACKAERKQTIKDILRST
jgi:tRNA(Ile2) C34 agmatinyltransferase TiaS